MKTNIFNSIVLVGWAILALAGCTREATEVQEGEGPIIFSAAATWQNEAATRTEYSGVFNTVSGATYERIDWVPGTDLIRIYCNQASVAGSQAKFSDYTVVAPVTAETEKSVAQIIPAAANSLRWGTGTHYFYALYPAPGTVWKYDGTEVVQSTDVSITGSGNNATVTGSVPAAQVVKWNESGKAYEPNMNYAYMYAAASADAWTPVSLSFRPLVTALQFTIKAADANVAGRTLSGFKLKSASTNLNGPFSAALTPTACTISDTGTGSGDDRKEVHVVIAQGDQKQLSQNDYFKVTLFTLAAATLNDLSIELSFTDGTVRKLDLKARNATTNEYEYITVAPCHKAFINSLSVPDNVFEYTLGTLSGGSVAYSGGTVSLSPSFASYRSADGGTTKQPVPFTLEYSLDDGATWTPGLPSWLTTDADLSGNTAVQALDFQAEAQLNTGTDNHHTTLAEDSRSRSDYDLSTFNVATTPWASNTSSTISRTTANCYVVQGYGTYKFPLVYGNGVKLNALNPDAYRAKKGVNGSYRPNDGVSGETGSGYYGARTYLGSFKDHLNNNIYTDGGTTSSPYLTSHLNKAASAFSAVLIWQDAPGLVVVDPAVVEENGTAYLKFSVPKDHITQGNALVGVLVDGAIAWSWHIWVTDENLSDTKYSIYNRYLFAPVNLGWCDAKATENYPSRSCKVRVTQAVSGLTSVALVTQTVGQVAYASSNKGNCLYYQWGRKDPFVGSDGAATSGSSAGTDKTYYPSQPEYALTTYGSGDHRQTIGTAIQHPNHYYSNQNWSEETYDQHWCSTDYINCWSSAIDGTGFPQNANAKTKTIYDPSPVGFRVPSMDAWRGTSDSWYDSSLGESGARFSSWDSSLLGRSLNGGFFPATGHRYDYDGSLHYIGQYGFYWATNPCGTGSEGSTNKIDYGKILSIYQSDWSTNSDKSASNGLAVRPVVDPLN